MSRMDKIEQAINRLTALKVAAAEGDVPEWIDDVPEWIDTALDVLYHYQDRQFDVQTPKGTLRVRAKTPRDFPEDYPGIYVEMAPEDSDDFGLLTVVEYNSREEVVQACVYGDPQTEFPTHTTKFR